MAYTTAKIAEPWRKLFPKITESATKIEITVRGKSFEIEIPKKPKAIASVKNLEYR